MVQMVPWLGLRSKDCVIRDKDNLKSESFENDKDIALVWFIYIAVVAHPHKGNHCR